ncbi:hypothetical protein HZ326_0230 [Fusarium oxysporum f. sp. albedinis]|nr:hypothetical protein HZ326_0230 [Fusarium oxysporum f. sp. albedinis]
MTTVMENEKSDQSEREKHASRRFSRLSRIQYDMGIRTQRSRRSIWVWRRKSGLGGLNRPGKLGTVRNSYSDLRHHSLSLGASTSKLDSKMSHWPTRKMLGTLLSHTLLTRSLTDTRWSSVMASTDLWPKHLVLGVHLGPCFKSEDPSRVTENIISHTGP